LTPPAGVHPSSGIASICSPVSSPTSSSCCASLSIVARALGEALADVRKETQRGLHVQMCDLRAEVCKFETALEQLRQVIKQERGGVLDLPALQSLRRVN
jgi:hypothetical protein